MKQKVMDAMQSFSRFYVLAGALATAVPQSRRTLGLMMGVHRQKRPKPADKKKGSAKGSRAAPKS